MQEEWYQWLKTSNDEIFGILCEKFPNYELTEAQKYSLMLHNIIYHMERFEKPNKFSTNIEWIDVLKLCGKSWSKRLQKKIKKSFPNVARLINFEVILPPVAEKWIWIGLGTESTYVSSEYLESSYIYPGFENIHSLQDLKNNIELVEKEVRSPTDCFFDFEDECVFYQDSQGCVNWAFDSHGVYIDDPDNLFEKQYVSKTLPEFLTRVYIEAQNFYNKRKEKFSNKI